MSHRPTSLYLIQSLDNGGVYVGITLNPRSRWNRHVRSSQRQLNRPLYDSMRKYGVERHTFAITEAFETRDAALDAEEWWIAYLRGLGARVFNLSARGSGRTGPMSPEHRAKISAAHKGRPKSAEHRASLRAANLGKSLSEEHKAAIGSSLKGKMLGIKHSPEHVARNSEAHRGIYPSAEARAKRSASLRKAWLIRRAKQS